MTMFFINCDKNEEIKSISTVELKALLSKESIQLLDVRSPEEINEGFIDKTLFANYFDDNFYSIASSQLDKNRPVYIYCRSGNRSGKSAKILQDKGYEVVNISGGYNQWRKED
jgi:rhodanese-related sulfurtransferase